MEVDRALELLSGKPRYHAFVRGLWLTGCRVSELLAATVGDLQFDRASPNIHLITLKRKRMVKRACPLDPTFMGELAVLVNAEGLGKDDRIFKWARSRAYEIVRDAFIAAGVERKRCHPHALRHGHAVHAIQNGVPLNIIQRALGHSSITTTSIYLQVTGEDVRAAYAKVKW